MRGFFGRLTDENFLAFVEQFAQDGVVKRSSGAHALYCNSIGYYDVLLH